MSSLIEVKLSRSLDYVDLHPIVDVHHGARGSNTPLFKDYIKFLLKDKHAHFFLVGDLINNGVKSSKTNVYQEVITPSVQKKEMIEMLKPLAAEGRIVAAADGNHEDRSAKEVDLHITQEIMEQLGLEGRYLGGLGFLKLSFGKYDYHADQYVNYVICGTHGTSNVAKVEAFISAYENLDGIISGHNHQPIGKFINKPTYNAAHKTLDTKHVAILVGTSWVENEDYAERKMYKPTAIKPNKLILDGYTRKMNIVL